MTHPLDGARIFDLPVNPITIPRNDLAAVGRPAFQSDVQMKGKASIYVAFKNVPVPCEPVDRTLEQIIECVTAIVLRFDRFLCYG